MNIENKEEKFKITVSSTSIHRLLKNIETIINGLNSQPRIQNFMAAKLTNGIPRDEAATISGISVRKINRERSSSVKLSIFHNAHVLKVTSILESI
jgi:hypothetical protein